MRPILALELSPEGIALHELSYDGKWRQLSYAALNDPFLPKKMAAMRGVAKASQGRFFKNQLWIPADQVHTFEAKITAEEPQDRLAEAREVLKTLPEYADGAYTLAVSENDSFGNATIAAVSNTVLADAKRFAKGYGFGTGDVTSASRINGFREQPYFGDGTGAVDKPALKIPLKVDLRKVGFFGMLALVLAGLGGGGYWAYTHLDFSDDPSKAIEATEGRIPDATEDPRAPIRPSPLDSVATAPTPAAPDAGTPLADIPRRGPDPAGQDTQIAQQGGMTSDLGNAGPPVAASTQPAPGVSQDNPETLASSGPDSLPAPESTGFPLVAAQLEPLENTAQASGFSGRGLTRYSADKTPGEFGITPRRTDVLPPETSTVALSAQLDKYNDSMGLTQVEANNAAARRQALLQEAQKLPPVIVAGRPDILPVLRGGVAVPEKQATPLPPPPPPATIAELQNLPPKVITGLPALTPFLRSGPNIADLPPEPVQPEAVAENATPETPAPDTPPAETPEETPAEAATDIAALQSVPPVVINRRPDWVLALRDGTIIPPDPAATPASGEAQPEAARLRPLPRPDSIAITALLNDPDLSQAAVPSSSAPARRAPDFAAKVDKMMAAFAESLRTTPQFTDAPRTVNLPTRANVAAEATTENGINLRDTSLIGVYGKPGAYRALIRSGRGKYTMVEVGNTYDRWKVVAISESSVRLQKGSKTKVLKLPG